MQLLGNHPTACGTGGTGGADGTDDTGGTGATGDAGDTGDTGTFAMQLLGKHSTDQCHSLLLCSQVPQLPSMSVASVLGNLTSYWQ